MSMAILNTSLTLTAPPPPPPPPPPFLGEANGDEYNRAALLNSIRTGKILKNIPKNQDKDKRAGEYPKNKLADRKFDPQGNLIKDQRELVENKNLPINMLLQKRQFDAQQDALNQAKIEKNKRNAEVLKKQRAEQWEVARIKTQQIVLAKELEESKKVTERVRAKNRVIANSDNKPTETNMNYNIRYLETINRLQNELQEAEEKLKLYEEQEQSRIELSGFDLGLPSSGLSEEYEREQEELLYKIKIVQLEEQLQAVQQEQYSDDLEDRYNTDLEAAIEFLQGYIERGGQPVPAIAFLQAEMEQGHDLPAAIALLKQNEIFIKQQEEEKTLQIELKKTAEETVKDFVKTITTLTFMLESILNNTSKNIQNRLSSFLSPIAAGDEESIKKGVWISGLYGTNKQGILHNNLAYKGHAAGVTIGFDVELADYLLGITYSNIRSKFVYNTNSNTTSVNSHIGSLYTQKDLGKGFTLQGVLATARNYIKNNDSCSGITGNYTNISYNFESLLNYNYLINQWISIIPNIGIRYGQSRDGIYKKNNIGIQQLYVTSKSQNLWTGIVGSRVLFVKQKISESVKVTLGIHGSIERHFNNRNKKSNVKVVWQDKNYEQNIILPKQPKMGYNIGASVLTEKGNIKVFVEYNCHLQKKYSSHQGSLKLKLLF